MRPFPQTQVAPAKLRCNAQSGFRTLFVAGLCLSIGLGLGALWESRRAKPTPVKTEGEAPAQDLGTLLDPSAPVSPMAATLPIEPAILAEVKRQLPNFASVSLEAGAQILREAALKDFQAALSQTEGQLKEAEARVARMEEAKSETGKQAALQDLQRLQAGQAAKLREFTTKSSAQIEALRQLKQLAR